MSKQKPEVIVPDKIGPASLFAYTKVELLARRARRQLLKAAAAIKDEKEHP